MWNPDNLEKHLRDEKQKARELRKSRWWQNRIVNCTCAYCDTPLDQKTATMDHLIPISRGGKSTKGNVVPCCKDCNNKKKYLLPMEWEGYLQEKKS